MSVTATVLQSVVDVLAAETVPDPGPATAPPGAAQLLVILSWAKWVGLVACVLGVIIVGGLLAVKNSRGEGFDNFGKLGYALAGAIIISGAVSIVGFVTT